MGFFLVGKWGFGVCYIHKKEHHSERADPSMPNRNRVLVPQSEAVLDRMKEEIAQELGVQLGPDAMARQNGSVGGEMTKRLIALAQQQLANHK